LKRLKSISSSLMTLPIRSGRPDMAAPGDSARLAARPWN
jgi:hypothetical protein